MISILIIPIFLLCVCICTGYVLSQISDRMACGRMLITGYIFCVGAFHIVAFPFMYFKASFSVLYYICIVYFVLSIGTALYFLYRQKNKLTELKNHGEWLKKNKSSLTLFVIILFCVAFQVIWVVYFQHVDIDDSYYLAEINTILHTNKIHSIDPASGIDKFIFSTPYELVSYEVLLSVIVKLFNINTAFFAHSVLPIFLIPLHYVIIYNIGKLLKKDFAAHFTLLYCALNLFSGYSRYSQGAFLLYRIWQGKAVMINIVVPILILFFLELYTFEIKNNNIILLFLTLLGGLHTTTVGLYLIPILYFALTIGYLIVNKKIYETFKLCIPVLLVTPLVIVKAILLFGSNNANGDFGTTIENLNEGVKTFSYSIELLEKFMGNNSLLLLVFGISIIFILIYGNQKERGIIAIPPIVLMITFLNPFFKDYIARYVTGVPVYWRLFWLLDIPFVIATMFVLALTKSKNITTNNLVGIIGVLTIAVCGAYILDNKGFEYRANKYKLDARTVQITDQVRKDADGKEVTLLLPEELSYGVREYCGDVRLLVNRYSESNYKAIGKEKELKRQQNLVHMLYISDSWDTDKLQQELEHFNVDYVLIYNREENHIPHGLSVVFKCTEYILYRCQ